MTDADSPEDAMRVGQTPLAKFVREKLRELRIRQTEFCRLTGFDQGLLSKIQNSMVSTLSLESALKLAVGLRVPPRILLELIGRPDLNELVLKAYGTIPTASGSSGGPNSSDKNIEEVRPSSGRSHSAGNDLSAKKKASQSLVEQQAAMPGGDRSRSEAIALALALPVI